MVSKAVLLERIEELHTRLEAALVENAKIHGAVANVTARYEREIREALADVRWARREPDRMRRQRMIRVIEEAKDLRAGEMLILQGGVEADPRPYPGSPDPIHPHD